MHLVILPGDGIGPEISAATYDILELLNQKFSLGLSFETHEIGLAALQREGTTFPPAAVAACRAADGIVLGPVSHATYPARAEGGINVSGELRITLDLYANIRPSHSRKGLPHWGRTSMDLVIVRENTEGFYADRNMHSGGGEFMPTPDIALAVRKITSANSRRIAQVAFTLARTRRKKVTAVHKANVMKVSDGLFLREVRAIAKNFPDIAGQDKANPTSLILSVAMLLDWLGRKNADPKFIAAAKAVEQSLDALLNDASKRTADLGGMLGTKAFTKALSEGIRGYGS